MADANLPIGSPVQIIQIIKERKCNADGRGHHRLHLDEKKMNDTFAKYKYEKCIIVSIVGPAQTGKSLFANWCLERLKSNDSKGNKVDRISGFPSKATESDDETETRGFVIWSEPFPVKMDEGTVYVFLMDTQGFAEENVADMMTFVGFNMLVSWGVIFNCFDVGEALCKLFQPVIKSVEPILNFLKQKPLDKMVFLIQQTKDIDNLSLARLRKLEKNKLQEIFNSEMELNESTQFVKDIFEGSFIDTCLYLLPSPGDCVREANYNGECNQLRPKYRATLKSTVEEILCFDGLCKTVSESKIAHCMTGSEKMIEFVDIVNMFNENNIITEACIADMRSKTASQSQIEKYVGDYRQKMETALNSSSLKSRDLERIHETISDAVANQYREVNSSPENYLATIRRIMAEYKLIKSEFEQTRRVKVEKAVTNLDETFTSNLREEAYQRCEVNEESKLDVLEEVTAKLERELQISNQTTAIEHEGNVSPEMNSILLSRLNRLKSQEQQQIKSEETIVGLIINMGMEVFRAHAKLGEEPFVDSELVNLLQAAENSALSVIASTCQRDNVSFKRVEQRIKKLISEETVTIKDKNTENINAKITEMKGHIGIAIENYIELMNKELAGDLLFSAEELDEIHTRTKNKTETSLKEIGLQSGVVGWTELLGDFGKSVEAEFCGFKKINEQNIQTLQEVVENAVGTQLEYYAKQLEAQLRTRTEAQMKELHESTLATLVADLNGVMVKLPASIKASLNTSFKEKVASSFKEAMVAWKHYQIMKSKEMEKVSDEARKFYEAQMETYLANKEYHQLSELEIFHSETVSKALDLYIDKGIELPPELEMKFITQLNNLCEMLKQKNSLNYTQNKAIGIDLGTTNCCVCMVQGGDVFTAKFDYETIIPSYLWLDEKSEDEAIGKDAKIELFSNRQKKNTIYDAKRLIGRQFLDEHIQERIRDGDWPFEVIDVDGLPRIKVTHNNKELHLSPEEVSAKILRKLKEMAESYFRITVTDAVITVPAYFGAEQCKMTRRAGELAGLTRLRIITEPVAAAMAFKLNMKPGAKTNVMVYDFGGGTLDVAILEILDNTINVKAVTGNNNLGGGNIDKNLVKLCLEKMECWRNDNVAKERLLQQCEKEKKTLSIRDAVTIKIGDQRCPVTRTEFNRINEKTFRRALIPVEECLKQAQMDKKAIDKIVLVGGSTRIPKIQTMLNEYFGRIVNTHVEPDEVVAQGAAIQAIIISGGQCDKKFETKVKNVTPYSIGIEVATGELSVVIPRNSPIPAVGESKFSTVVDFQETAQFKIYQGNDLQNATANDIIAVLNLNDLPPELKGCLELLVIMTLDVEGILKVRATCTRNNVTEEIEVTPEPGRMKRNQAGN